MTGHWYISNCFTQLQLIISASWKHDKYVVGIKGQHIDVGNFFRTDVNSTKMAPVLRQTTDGIVSSKSVMS